MKKVTIFLLLFFAGLMVSGQVRIDQTTSQLASKYYSERDFGKAAPVQGIIYHVGHHFLFQDVPVLPGRIETV